jgi:hypothetical protein
MFLTILPAKGLTVYMSNDHAKARDGRKFGQLIEKK